MKMSLFGVLLGYTELQAMHITWEMHKNIIPTMLEKCSHGVIKLLVIKFYWLSLVFDFSHSFFVEFGHSD